MINLKDIKFLILTISSLLIKCTSTQKYIPYSPNWQEIRKFAEYAKIVYEDDTIIRTVVSNTHEDITIEDAIRTKGKFFVGINHDKKEIIISTRGTANIKNALVDMMIKRKYDNDLKIDLHNGFLQSESEIFVSVIPIIEKYKKDYKINITGHSLGGAIAIILAMDLKFSGYNIEKIITFGQPKVTGKKGIKKFKDLPLLRIVHDKDPVPLVPPFEIFKFWGKYKHLGAELLLADDSEYYTYLDKERAQGRFINSFWINSILNIIKADSLSDIKQDIEDHFMQSYIKSIDEKIKKAKQIPLNEWRKL